MFENHISLSHRAGDEAVENPIARDAAARSTDRSPQMASTAAIITVTSIRKLEKIITIKNNSFLGDDCKHQ
jgi:hypothetical protein